MQRPERPVNRIIVEIVQHTIETESGFQLFPEVEYKPEQSEPISGIVLSEETILNHTGCKRFYTNSKNQSCMYKFSDFSPFLKAGDRVWFNYQASRSEQWMWEDQNYWIGYDEVIFYERDGVLHAADGMVLVKPIEITESFMEYTNVIGEHQDRGTVFLVGNPLKTQSELGCAIGDVILFDPKYVDKSITYKGNKVWAVDFDMVLCVL